MVWISLLNFLILVLSGFLLYFSGKWTINGLRRIARFLNWREFVVAFFIMAFAAALPNLFVGIFSALKNIPQLSFGDVVGGNVVDLTLAVALAVLFAPKRHITTKSRLVQKSALFTALIAVLPVLLMLDGILSRIDGAILIIFLFIYLFWLFSKEERFSKVYDENHFSPLKNFKTFLKDLAKLSAGIVFLLLGANGIVASVQFFAQQFAISPVFIGVLIIGLGNALPETYFSIISAKKGQTWMILGNLMGSVIAATCLVLGVVALICPIKITASESDLFFVARFFLVISALFFFFFVKTDKNISKKEALFLLFLYFMFLFAEIFYQFY